ncbi:MAG: hypothetical protein GX443_02910 [Deltaproteobacteria bacterium]|nr:hypothetical protein [Deltaproteobacteria bacterium]
MSDEKSDRECLSFGESGLLLKCHRCGRELPLLHPHIMVERYDEDENMICESCYAKHYSEK